MRKNVCNKVSGSSFLRDRKYKERNASLDWLLASGDIKKFPALQGGEELFLSEGIPLSKGVLQEYKTEAEEGIARIEDPLWRKICLDILEILGPVAFKNLWKVKLVSVSSERRKAYLACPNRSVAASIEQYQFVVIGALKKFYPFLTSINIEISENAVSAVTKQKLA